jgi:secondary thiamine-phosphate synthase enzyme
MAPIPAPSDSPNQRYLVHHERVTLVTRHRVEFLDVTDFVIDQVRRSGITDGTVNVQTLHTTTAVRVNENEPLLLEDLALLFERLAPRSRRWLHDDLDARRGPLPADERLNGEAHARAVLLGTAETLNVVGGDVELGRWQRIFLVEFDGPRRRTLSLTVSGIAGTRRAQRPAGEGETLDLVELRSAS